MCTVFAQKSRGDIIGIGQGSDVGLRNLFVFYEDPTSSARIEDLIENDYLFDHHVPKGRSIFPGAVWLKATFQSQDQARRFVIDNKRTIANCEIYIAAKGKLIHHAKVGLYDREKNNTVFNGIVDEFVIQDQQAFTIYIRQSYPGHKLNSDFNLIEYNRFLSLDHSRQLFYGLFVGFVLAMIVYNFFLFLSLRDVTYLYYVLCILFTDLFNSLCIYGLISEMLIRDISLLSKYHLEDFIYSFMITFNILFACKFLQVEKRNPSIAIVGYGFAIFNVLFWAVAQAFDLHAWHSPFLWTFIRFSSYAILSYGVIEVIRGNRSATLFVAAWGTLLVALVVETLYLAGDLKDHLLTRYALPIGSCVETCLLSLALARRFKDNEQKRMDSCRERDIALARYNATTEAVVMVAHDVKKPYTQFEYMLQFMASNRTSQEILDKCRKWEPTLRKAIRDADKLLHDILQIGGAKQIDRGSCDIPKLVYESIEEVFVAKDSLSVKVRYNWESSVNCYANPFNLKRVIVNVIANALEAMRDDGEITISATGSSRFGPGFVRIGLKNTNSSIPVENLERVFDPFYSTKKQGYGIGLATVKKFVELDGGKVECLSDGRSFVEVVLHMPLCLERGCSTHTCELAAQAKKYVQTLPDAMEQTLPGGELLGR